MRSQGNLDIERNSKMIQSKLKNGQKLKNVRKLSKNFKEGGMLQRSHSHQNIDVSFGLGKIEEQNDSVLLDQIVDQALTQSDQKSGRTSTRTTARDRMEP